MDDEPKVVTIEALEALYRANFISSIQGNMLFDAALQAIAMQIFGFTVTVYPDMNAPELYMQIDDKTDMASLSIEQQTIAHTFTLEYAYSNVTQLAFDMHEAFCALVSDLNVNKFKIVPGTMRINLHLIDRFSQTYGIMLLCVSVPTGEAPDEKNQSQDPTSEAS